jgi:hypothetical protein
MGVMGGSVASPPPSDSPRDILDHLTVVFRIVEVTRVACCQTTVRNPHWSRDD